MSASVSILPPPSGITSMQEAEIRRVFESQRATALRLRSSSVAERIAKLKRLRTAVLSHSQAIIEAGHLDMRRPPAEVEFGELMPVIMDISDACKHLNKWLRPKRVWPTLMMFGTSSQIRYEPRGRCLIIAPWNYPVNLSFGPLIAAIASGNAVMLKTSEMAPNFSAVMVKIIREVFSENEIAIFEGDASVATSLLALPFDHIFFTGAPAIGKIVMAAAARHLASVTLELGGKSPTIIDDTADLDLAVRTIGWTKFMNSGQTCIAPDHLYVHEAVADKVIALFKQRLDQWYGENEAAKSAAFTRVINQRHTRRIGALLSDARQRGAKVLYGGVVDEPAHFVAPTLLTDIPADASIMQEEIFGPLLPIIRFSSLDEVIDRINAAPKPLALYIWSRNKATADTVIQRTSAGGTCINHCAAQFLHHNLPFGGVNNSGIGSYHGEFGIKAFSHERAIVRTRINLARIFFPPYKPVMRKVMALMLRYL